MQGRGKAQNEVWAGAAMVEGQRQRLCWCEWGRCNDVRLCKVWLAGGDSGLNVGCR